MQHFDPAAVHNSNNTQVSATDRHCSGHHSHICQPVFGPCLTANDQQSHFIVQTLRNNDLFAQICLKFNSLFHNKEEFVGFPGRKLAIFSLLCSQRFVLAALYRKRYLFFVFSWKNFSELPPNRERGVFFILLLTIRSNVQLLAINRPAIVCSESTYWENSTPSAFFSICHKSTERTQQKWAGLRSSGKFRFFSWTENLVCILLLKSDEPFENEREIPF